MHKLYNFLMWKNDLRLRRLERKILVTKDQPYNIPQIDLGKKKTNFSHKKIKKILYHLHLKLNHQNIITTSI